jgi:ABC-2 type transport system ATP-binding protein
MAEPLATFERVSKTYRLGFGRTNLAVNDVSFTIPSGALLGLVGPNGSGKSTSIKMLLGLIAPSAGSIAVLGGKPGDPGVFRRIGYIAENVSFSDTLKAPEILAYHARAHGLPAARRRARTAELLEEVGLAQHGKKTVRQFSKGMVQRLALATALVHDPELLILDEPMSGLDPIGRRFVIDLLARHHRAGKTICFSSHLLHDIDELCDRLVVINKGKLIFEGEKSAFGSLAGAFRLVFSFRGALPAWAAQAATLGPDTWVLTGEPGVLLDLLPRLREAGAGILEFGHSGVTLESSFFHIIGA